MLLLFPLYKKGWTIMVEIGAIAQDNEVGGGELEDEMSF
jgi:hypothetical protein